MEILQTLLGKKKDLKPHPGEVESKARINRRVIEVVQTGWGVTPFVEDDGMVASQWRQIVGMKMDDPIERQEVILGRENCFWTGQEWADTVDLLLGGERKTEDTIAGGVDLIISRPGLRGMLGKCLDPEISVSPITKRVAQELSFPEK